MADIDPTAAAVLATIGGIFSAGGLLVKLVEWAKSRTDNAHDLEKKEIDADLTLNERLLERIRVLEERSDKDQDELARLHAQNQECERRARALEAEQTKLARDLADSIRTSQRLAREAENLRSDLSTLKRHVEELESRNRTLRADAIRRAEGGNGA